jgi:hypothetical protein
MSDWAPRDHRDARIEELEEENERLRAELQNIVNAKPSEWGSEPFVQFYQWARNRARAALRGGDE